MLDALRVSTVVAQKNSLAVWFSLATSKCNELLQIIGFSCLARSLQTDNTVVLLLQPNLTTNLIQLAAVRQFNTIY